MATPAPSATSSPPHSAFLRQFRGTLASAMVPEMDVTLKVGVMSAAGLTRPEILAELKHSQPDADELDVRMAFLRLKRIANSWRTT